MQRQPIIAAFGTSRAGLRAGESGDARHRHTSRSALPRSDAPLPTDNEWQHYADQTGTTCRQLREWCRLYGSHLAEVAARLPAERSHDSGLDWHRAMMRYAVECEMAQRLEDVYVRRSGLMLFSPDNDRRWQKTQRVGTHRKTR